MKTFAIIATAGFVIFVITAVYLLAGGERSHVTEPVASKLKSPERDFSAMRGRRTPEHRAVTVENAPPPDTTEKEEVGAR